MEKIAGFLGKWLMLCALGVVLAACAYEEKPYEEKPLAELYTTAYKKMEQASFEEACDAFDAVEQQYPYSAWAAKAQLMSAYCAYKAQLFARATATLDTFIVLHPSSPYIEYAYYLRGLSYYTDIMPVFRDREMADLSLQAFEDVVRRFPHTEYAQDATLKIDFVREHLASQEMFIAKTYLKEREYVAALRRFGEILRLYPRSALLPEVLYRLVECQVAIGVFESARRTLGMLAHNFPEASWYKLGYDLLKEVAPEVVTPSKTASCTTPKKSD